jgi:hypothetical protein
VRLCAATQTRLRKTLFILGIGLATGAPDTQPAPTSRGRQPENSLPPVGYPTGGFVFLAPENPNQLEEHDMTYSTYYRTDICTAWRFSSLRSGQPAASVRSLTGGNPLQSADPANCRTPQ